jgi:hypothetical protein
VKVITMGLVAGAALGALATSGGVPIPSESRKLPRRQPRAHGHAREGERPRATPSAPATYTRQTSTRTR